MAGYVSPFETASGSSKASNKYVSPFASAAKGTNQLRKQQDTADAAAAEDAYINPPANATNTPKASKKGGGFLHDVGAVTKGVIKGLADVVIDPAKIAVETGRAAVAEATNNGAATEAATRRAGAAINDSLPAAIVKPVYHLAKGEVIDNGVALLAQARGDKATQKAAEDMKNKDISIGNTIGSALDVVGGPAANKVLSVLKGVVGKTAAKKAIANISQKTVDTLDNAASTVSNHSIMSKVPVVAKGDTEQAILNRGYVQRQYQALIKPVQDAAKGMSEKDKQLIDRIEVPGSTKVKMTPELAARRVEAVASKADNPEQFKKVVGMMRDAYNKRLAGDVTLGRKVGFRQNYLPHLFNTKDDNVMSTLDHLEQQAKKLNKNPVPGYVKPRTVDTYADAAKIPLKGTDGKVIKDAQGKVLTLGDMRKNSNALEDFSDAMTSAGQEHSSQALKLGLMQAHPGKVRVGETGFDPKLGEHFTSLHIAGGKGLTAPESLAKDINTRATHEYASGVAGRSAEIYDTKINNPLKTSILGGGLFHMATTAGSTAGQQLVHALFHPIRAPGMLVDNLKVIAGTVSKSTFNKLSASQEKRGLTDFADKVGTTLGRERFGGDVTNYKVPIIHNIHSAIFDRQIPAMKLMVMEQRMNEKFPGMDFHNPTAEQLAYGRNIANGINNLGGINRAIQGLSPTQAKILSRVWLAPDYTEGRVRNWANALNFTKNGAKEKIARETIVGKSIVFAVPGLAAATAAGLIDWNDPKSIVENVKEQLLDPQIALNEKGAPTATNPGGVPKSFHLPTTYLSEIGKIIKPMFDNTGGDKLAGAKSFVTNRSSAALSVGEKLVQNKDYYGNDIIGGNKTVKKTVMENGKPVVVSENVPNSKTDSALNVASQVLPIPAVQGVKQGTGQQPLRDTILNTAGGRVSADTNSAESSHSTAVNDFFNTYKKTSTAKSAAAKQVTSLLLQGKPNQAKRVADQWNQSIYQRIAPFKTKYKDSYNPAWDTDFKSLVIPTTDRAFKARTKSGKLSQALLQ